MQRDSWSRQVRQNLIMLRLREQSEQIKQECTCQRVKSKEGRKNEEFYVKFQQPHCGQDQVPLKKREGGRRNGSNKSSKRASSQTRDFNSINYTFSPSRFTPGNSSNKRSPNNYNQSQQISSLNY
jgi:hypothetical protein